MAKIRASVWYQRESCRWVQRRDGADSYFSNDAKSPSRRDGGLYFFQITPVDDRRIDPNSRAVHARSPNEPSLSWSITVVCFYILSV
jgi:hypothetical protein